MIDKIDWKDAPEGATHYTIKESGVIWFKDANSFWSIWDSGKWEAIGLPACKLIPRPTSAAIPVSQNQTLEAELSALRTQAVADAAEIERIQIAAKRYETLRTLNPRQFADLYAKNLETGVAFDELVDGLARGDL